MSYQLVGSSVSLNTLALYERIDEYFQSPTLQKMYDENNTSVYMVRIRTGLASPKQRYLVVVTTPDRRPKGTVMPLRSLEWVSFQTRLLDSERIEKDEKIVTHAYQPSHLLSKRVMMKLLKRYPGRTEYEIEGVGNECVAALMHTNRENEWEFPDRVTLSGSLELFRTVLMIRSGDLNE